MIDLSAYLYDPVYRAYGVSATITLTDSDATEIEVTAIYTNSGRNIGAEQVGVHSVEASASVRLSELSSIDLADLFDASIAIEHPSGTETWVIKEWVKAPGKAGEAAGEIRLILRGTA